MKSELSEMHTDTALLYRHDMTSLSLQKELVPWVALATKPLVLYSTSQLLNSQSVNHEVFMWREGERGVTS